jgi:hypothetical protein
MSNPLSAAEAKELIRFCETGRLYEVDPWIRAGRSLTVPGEVRKTPLSVAISTGFHSHVELLLRQDCVAHPDGRTRELHHRRWTPEA